MNLALLVTSAVLAVAWIPVLVRFFRNWRSRANPISLAICFLVAFSIYLCLVPFLGQSGDPLAALVIEGVNAVTCLFFYVSFGWARRKWSPKTGERRPRNGDFPSEETPR